MLTSGIYLGKRTQQTHYVAPPPNGAVPPSTLGRERRSCPKKRLHNHSQNSLNTPGYIAKTWAHYNNIRGAPFPRINVTEWVKCTKQSPNQTPMHPERCHNCASQWHPDTMHNMGIVLECSLILDIEWYVFKLNDWNVQDKYHNLYM